VGLSSLITMVLTLTHFLGLRCFFLIQTELAGTP
jgi:hypothetical protein